MRQEGMVGWRHMSAAEFCEDLMIAVERWQCLICPFDGLLLAAWPTGRLVDCLANCLLSFGFFAVDFAVFCAPFCNFYSTLIQVQLLMVVECEQQAK